MPANTSAHPTGPSQAPAPRFALVLSLALAVGLAVILGTYRDYGAAWDDGTMAHYGELAIRYFASGGQDKSCNDFVDMRFYGPLFELLPALFYDPADPAKWDVRHLFVALLALLCIPAVWLYARKFADPRVAVFAIIAVAMLPRFYGHWFNNSKDIPFAVLMCWYMLALAHAFTPARVRWSGIAWCGIAMGLGLCARSGGFPLFALFLAGAAATWLLTRAPGADGQSLWSASWRLLPKLAAVFAIAWPIMVLPWPWAHENPLLRPVEAMRVAANFHTTMPVLFEGKVYYSTALPWYYIAKYVVIGTPLAALAAALLGTLAGGRVLFEGWRTQQARMVALTWMWCFVPIAIFAVVRPNVYGGERHFLFVMPALGILAGLGAAAVLRRVRGPLARCAAWVALLALLLLPVRDLVRLHPYQVTYYNALVGGVGGVTGKYLTDYPLSSYREAVHWVNAQAEREPGRPIKVVITASPPVMMWVTDYAGPLVELVPVTSLPFPRPSTLPDGYDYYIGSTRNEADRPFADAPIVHEIGRDGGVFTVIKGRTARN